MGEWDELLGRGEYLMPTPQQEIDALRHEKGVLRQDFLQATAELENSRRQTREALESYERVRAELQDLVRDRDLILEAKGKVERKLARVRDIARRAEKADQRIRWQTVKDALDG